MLNFDPEIMAARRVYWTRGLIGIICFCEVLKKLYIGEMKFGVDNIIHVNLNVKDNDEW